MTTYLNYALPDNNLIAKPGYPNNERALEFIVGARPHIIRYKPGMYGDWVRRFSGLYAVVGPHMGTNECRDTDEKGAKRVRKTREQSIARYEDMEEIPVAMLARLLRTSEDVIEQAMGSGKNIYSIVPDVPSPGDDEILGQNSVPSLHPRILSFGLPMKARLASFLAHDIAALSNEPEIPRMEYSFSRMGDGEVDTLQVRAYLEKGLIKPLHEAINVSEFRAFLDDLEVEFPEALSQANKLAADYARIWELENAPRRRR